ncbi:MAG: helicase DnaB, partial [Atopostipes sp.]|nr:helicase DnaB [Atopostipes sp.]
MVKYPWQEINPKDFVYIESEEDLTMQDVRILTKLYKPIIGGKAYSFYQSLFSELDFKANQKMTTVSKLLRKMDMGIADFYQARIRLEGLGLLKNYRSKSNDDEYIYELDNPL